MQPKDPVKAAKATFEKLNPQSGYIFRLVATNPSGTTYGKFGNPVYTLPRSESLIPGLLRGPTHCHHGHVGGVHRTFICRLLWAMGPLPSSG